MYIFNNTLDHRYNNSYRWEQPEGRDDILGMGTADLDYFCAPCIRDATKIVSDENTFNYRKKPAKYYEAIISWFKRRHNMRVDRKWIRELPSTIGSIRLALGAYCRLGDYVLMQSPYFTPIEMAIKGAGCHLLRNPMNLINGRYELDLEDFEEKIKKYRPAMFILVSPQNPTGRVFSLDELKRMVDICYKYRVMILSDEVHFLITYDGLKHIPILDVSDKAKEICIQLFSFSKGFNMMSLPHAMILIADDGLRKRWDDYLLPYDFHYASNSFSIAAVTAIASGKGDEWLVEANDYLKRNRDLFIDLIDKKQIPIIPLKPEAGFLFWIDCRKTGIAPEQLGKFFLEKARISLNNGLDHGEEGRGFIRLNFGVTEEVLRESVKRMEAMFFNKEGH
ncbi:MAG TPA: aminotransferase class I/II-fold pyridoxal phosphate-dependent enzyme [Candidatus Blautia faecipullorum]|nr:aminotransferase class I/II-fold pyridoxal phosphate-dependent enzyme [Candidatus Blautia faecipullorum]